jgi:hypothetical protein
MHLDKDNKEWLVQEPGRNLISAIKVALFIFRWSFIGASTELQRSFIFRWSFMVISKDKLARVSRLINFYSTDVLSSIH